MLTTINKVSLVVFFMVSLPACGMIPEINYQSKHNNDNDAFEFDTLSTVEDSHLVDTVYAMAPTEIHELVHALKINLSSEAYMRPLLFTGPPGTGKTTLARILPIILNKSLEEILAIEGFSNEQIKQKCNFFKECSNNFYYKYVNASELGNQYQHSKQHELKNLIRKVLNTNKHCVLVIDEINALFSGQKNENSSQAYETALALKHLFERLETSKKVLLILTTNYPEQIPKKYGLRSWFLQGNVLHFDQPDHKKQHMAVAYHLKKSSGLKSTILNKELEHFVRALDGWSFRRIAALCNTAAQYACIEDEQKPILLMKHLNNAFKDLKIQYGTIEFNKEVPSEQERFCNESLVLQEECHNNQLHLSKQTMELNSNLHNLQLAMQLRMHNTARTRENAKFNPPGCGYPLGDRIIDGWDTRRCLIGDSKNILPENIRSYVDTEVPFPSLFGKTKTKEQREEEKRKKETESKFEEPFKEEPGCTIF